MDLASQKEKRESRMNAKKEAIRSQAESAPATEAEAVAEAEAVEDKK
jgi:hypothetical protein